jgi:hypothetical protein
MYNLPLERFLNGDVRHCGRRRSAVPVRKSRRDEVEVERAEGRGCLTRSVKLAGLVRCFCCSAQKP